MGKKLIKKNFQIVRKGTESGEKAFATIVCDVDSRFSEFKRWFPHAVRSGIQIELFSKKSILNNDE